MATDGAPLYVRTSEDDVTVEGIAQGILEHCASVLVIGTDLAGQPYYACSHGDMPGQLWAVEQFKRHLLALE